MPRLDRLGRWRPKVAALSYVVVFAFLISFSPAQYTILRCNKSPEPLQRVMRSMLKPHSIFAKLYVDAHAADPESLRDGARTLPAARISRTLSTGTDSFRPL